MDEPILLTLDKLENHRDILSLLFDGIRTVDPIKKIIVEYKENRLIESEFKCYASWKRSKICDNCISMRTILEKKIHYKLEYGDGRVFMVTSVPVMDEGRIIALELSKDVTDSMLVENSSSTKDEILHFIDNINLQHIRDSLTGLYNRRFIDERLPAEIMNSLSEGLPLSIIMADIDYFKKVNDTFGHIGGDFVLEEFAALLTDSMAGLSGWTARYGGEEFLICLQNTGKESAERFAELLRERIENNVITYNGQEIRITSSFGVYSLNGGALDKGSAKTITSDSFINYADMNLYAAKNAGRNRVVSGETDI